MNKQLLTTFFLLLAIPSGICSAAPKIEPPSSVAVPPPAISVTLLIPGHADGKVLDISDGHDYVNVILQNMTKKPLTIWKEWCSWGWYTVYLKVTALNGESLPHPILLQKGTRAWAADFPDPVTLQPGQKLVRRVYFKDLWGYFYNNYQLSIDLFLAPSSVKRRTATLQAVFSENQCSIIPSMINKNQEDGAWTGISISPPVTVTLE